MERQTDLDDGLRGWSLSKLVRGGGADVRVDGRGLIEVGVVTANVLTLHANGPAVMMKVFKDNGDFWYSVDMVPTFNCDGEFYVPKSYKEIEKPGEVFTTWRRSFSIDEKNILRSVDKGSGCRRKCLRMLKAILPRETSLQSPCTYFLKTTLLNMVDDMTEDDSRLNATVTRYSVF